MSGSGLGDGDGDGAARLRRLLGDEQLSWVIVRLRARLQSGADLTGVVTLRSATPEQRSAVARLFGSPVRAGGSARVSLDDLDALLRRSGAWTEGLEAAVVALTGPVQRRSDAAVAELAAWDHAWTAVRTAVAAHPRPALRPVLRDWWEREVATGTARRTAGSPAAAAELADQLAGVLVRLPADGVAIGALAHAATGAAHALDPGPLASLALRAARATAGLPARQRSAAVDRETWAAVGVVRDEVSSTVLALGLPVDAPGAAGTALAAWAQVGEPVVLTLRQLRLHPPRWAPPAASGPSARAALVDPPPRVVWSVENPVVLTAVADRALHLGVGPPPVVCTSGRPSAATVVLLEGLRGAGWEVRHHGDLDPDGISITQGLVQRVAARPWRMGAEDYREALAAGYGRRVAVGRVEASWDSALGAEMASKQQVVEEEALLETLVADVLGSRAI